MGNIYKIKLSLNYSNPEIYRVMLVDSDIMLSQLHDLIQIVMEWEEEHLHSFNVGEKSYEPRYIDDEMWDEGINIDYTGITLSEILSGKGKSIEYHYDFGDSHEVTIRLLEIIDGECPVPQCLEAVLRAPVEDVGGIGGYYQMLEILKNPKDEEYDFYREWLGLEDGKKFRTKALPVSTLNRQLAALVKTKYYQTQKAQKAQKAKKTQESQKKGSTASSPGAGPNNHKAEGTMRQIHDFLDDYQKQHGSFDSFEQANKVLAEFIKKLNEKK